MYNSEVYSLLVTGQKIMESQAEIVLMKNITSFKILSSMINSPSHIRCYMKKNWYTMKLRVLMHVIN
jgi:hypothetical protein